jgi:hypothetical protein
MAAALQTAAEMGRPKSDKPKDAVVSLRTYPEVRDHIEEYARREHRTVAQMADLLLREAIAARLKGEKKSAASITGLP